MYIVRSIVESQRFPDHLRVAFNSDFPILLSKEHEITTISGWPKEYGDFDLEKHVFKTVKDLRVGDQVITY